MSSVVDKKYEELDSTVQNLSEDNCLLLSTMSMSRIWFLIKFISTQKGFEKLALLDSLLDEAVDKVYNKTIFSDEKLQEYIDICNELIPIMEEYTDDEEISEFGSNVMGFAYTLIELLYYFIDMQGIIMKQENREGCKKFIVIAAVAIEQYLGTVYHSLKDPKLIEAKINESELLTKEIKRIDEDIIFLESNRIDKSKVVDRINTYKTLNILLEMR